MIPCIEKKLTLSGEVRPFSCERIHLDNGFGILKYVIDREYGIKGVRLLPGDVTCALYWEDRSYTLYVWHLKRDGSTLYYFNIADSISLQPHEFIWRDLAVDVLVDGQGKTHVLDEDELLADLSAGLAEYIQKAKDHILAHFRDIIKEADQLIQTKTNC